MKIKSAVLALSLVNFTATPYAQGADQQGSVATPLVATPVVPTPSAGQLLVPRNTAIPLTVNNEVSSKTYKEGDTFALSVAQDIIINNYVVIPKGTRGVGEITWRTGKGAFGKSAKMEFELRYLEVGQHRLPLVGKHRIEGSGNTGATIGAVVAVGVFGAFVTGKSAVIAQGREFVAHSKEDFTVATTSAVAASPVVSTAVAVTPAVAAAEPVAPVEAISGVTENPQPSDTEVPVQKVKDTTAQ